MSRSITILSVLLAWLGLSIAACSSQDSTDNSEDIGNSGSVEDMESRSSGDDEESQGDSNSGSLPTTSQPLNAPTMDGDGVYSETAAGGVATQSEPIQAATPTPNSGSFSAEDADMSPSMPGPVRPADNSGDRYEDVGTNPFVIVEHDPFSTFAADVDTASYDIFRRDIKQGILPQPESVRLEEYVNNFSYDYPAPSPESEHPFSISLQAAPDLFENGTTVLRVGIQGELPPEREAANVVFLIDTSGSMNSYLKLPLVQHVLTSTVDLLDEGDKISIVTYAGSVGVALAPTDASDKPTIKDVIYNLSSSGSTAGAAGIDLAYQQAEAGFMEGGINQVILCTDGDFNVGPSTNEELVDLIEEKRRSGVTLTVLGFGTGNLNDSMMEQISNAGNGIYAMISDYQQADDYVEKKMISNLVQIAKDMKIQVEFNPEKVYAYRLLGYENRDIADEDFRDDTVDAGEIGAGHRVTALYELVMAGDSLPDVENTPEAEDGDPVEGEREIDEQDMILVKVRYKDVDATEEDPAYEVSATMTDAEVESSQDQGDDDFRWAVAMAAFAEILKQSPYANLDALSAIEEIITDKDWLDPDRAEFVDLFSLAKTLVLKK